MRVAELLTPRARERLLWALPCSWLAGLGSAALVALINQALAAQPGRYGSLAWQFAATAVLTPVFRWLSQVQFAALQQGALARLRELLGAHIARTELVQVEEPGASRFMAVLIEDAGTVAEFFTALPRLALQSAIVLAGFGYLGWMSWQALVLALVLVCLGSLTHLLAVRRASAHLERARDVDDALYGHFRALVAGAKELRLSRARKHKFLHEDLAGSIELLRRHRERGLLTYVGAGSWGAFMFFVVIGGIIFGLDAVVTLEPRVRSGYALMLVYIMFPLEDLLEAVPDLLRTRIALQRIASVCGGDLLAAPTLSEVTPARALEQLSVQGVTYGYELDHREGAFEIGPIDLELRPSEIVFVVGGNGAGKTTLAKLLVGLYRPHAGHILYNGVAVEGADPVAYREQFSVVFADSHVFDRLLGLRAFDLDARANHLLATLGLAHKVSVENGVFSTTRLSSGQTKRLALLTACLEDRPIYVFDEWAANQDVAYKDVFYHQILPELRARGKAVLAITHDDRYFHAADRCLKLEDGRLVDLETRTRGDATERRAPSAVGSPVLLLGTTRA